MPGTFEHLVVSISMHMYCCIFPYTCGARIFTYIAFNFLLQLLSTTTGLDLIDDDSQMIIKHKVQF